MATGDIFEKWHDARFMHDLLSLCGHEEVRVCPACVKRDKGDCPHRGSEPVGPCAKYIFDHTDPDVHVRVNEHIVLHAESMAKGRCEPRLKEEPELTHASS